MQHRRSDGPDGTLIRYPRNSRFAETADGWFFLTREGVSVGPYETRFDAEVSASLLIARLSQLDRPEGAVCTIQEFLGDPANPVVRPSLCRPVGAAQPRAARQRLAAGSLMQVAVQKAWTALRMIMPARGAASP